MGQTLKVVGKNAETKEPARAPRTSALAEDRQAEYLLSGKDERGRRVWFYRVQVAGLYTREFGPFIRKSDAIEGFDEFLDKTLQLLCDCLVVGRDGVQAREFIQLPAYMNQPDH